MVQARKDADDFEGDDRIAHLRHIMDSATSDFEKAAVDYPELIESGQKEEFAEAYPTNSPSMLNRVGTKWELDTDSIL